MIDPQLLELPMSLTSFYGTKDVQAIQGWLHDEIIALERLSEKKKKKKKHWGIKAGRFTVILHDRNLALNSNAAQNYKYVFGRESSGETLN